MNISDLDALLRESFSAGQRKRQLRLLPAEATYIKQNYARFQVLPSEALSEERTWYDVSLT